TPGKLSGPCRPRCSLFHANPGEDPSSTQTLGGSLPNAHTGESACSMQILRRHPGGTDCSMQALG
ncbi:hypothetical protein NDU88_006667, partial [Pleurodeles waltl]